VLLGAGPVYEHPGPDWPGLVEDVLGAPVALRSYGPTAAEIKPTRVSAVDMRG